MNPFAPDLSDVTPEMARHVLWHFGEGGHRAGSFTTALIELIARADPANRHRMGLGFPEYAAAVAVAQNDGGGIAQLRHIAEGRPAVARAPATTVGVRAVTKPLFFPAEMVEVFNRVSDDMAAVHGVPYQRSRVPSEFGADARMRTRWLDEADRIYPFGWLAKGRGFRIQFDTCSWFLAVWGWGEDTERLCCPEDQVEATLRRLLRLDGQTGGAS